MVEEDEIVLLHPQPPQLPRHSGVIAAFVALAIFGVLGWKLEQGKSPPATAPPRHVTQSTARRPPPPTRARPRAAPVFTLVAARGRCWVEAHADSRDGRLLYHGTLELAQRLRLPARRLWLRVGAPWNVDARLNGKHVVLPDHVADLVVTPAAVRITTA